MPLYQRIIIYLKWVVSGAIAIGILLDSISNAINLITIPRAIVCTSIIFLLWGCVQIIIKYRSIEWRTKDDKSVKITKLKVRHHLTALGMILLFWVPLLITFGSQTFSDNEETAKTKGPFAPLPFLSIRALSQVERGPIWGWESFNDDEIVVKISGEKTEISSEYKKHAIVVFWRLAQGFETNWHVGRRRLDGNWELVKLRLGQVHKHDDWQLVVGGIECKKNYSGTIAVILVAVPMRVIEEKGDTWVDDSIGWGFKELPNDQGTVLSQIMTFETRPIRR